MNNCNFCASFEAWVKNPHMLNRRTEPGYADEYEHPWTSGAWAAWKECHANQLAQSEARARELWETMGTNDMQLINRAYKKHADHFRKGKVN